MSVLLPLMVLSKGGKRRDVVDDAITTIQTVEGEDARELLSLTYMFASLVFAKEADRRWLKRRFRMFEDALKNSWAYQEIMQEGEQKRAIAELRRQRRVLDNLVEMRFPRIIEMAKLRGNTIDTSEALDDLILKIFAASSEEEARRILSQ